MVKIRVKLDRRRKMKNSEYPVKISVHRNSKTLYIPLNISLKDTEWDERKEEVVKRPDRQSLNIYIMERLSSVNINLLKLQTEGKIRSLTDRQFLDFLQGENAENSPHYFGKFYEQYLSLISNKGTKRIYTTTQKKLQQFCGTSYSSLLFEDITPSWLKTFEKFLSGSSPSANARAIHFRNIRAVFNAAIDDNYISHYPFRRFEIKYQETPKLALTITELRQLYNLHYDDHRQKYIDIFFIGFFLIGINLVDMAGLRAIENGRVIYTRTKTHKLYSIKVEPEAMTLFDKYKGKKQLLSFFDNVNNYRTIANHQSACYRAIAKDLGWKRLTYYSCRHTWATLAAELDIPDEVISMALGHSSVSVTDIYIKRNRQKIDVANRKVIDFLLKTE